MRDYLELIRMLQLFADGGDGGGEGGGDGAAPSVGDSPAADGQDALRAMGVPEAMLKKTRAKYSERAKYAARAQQETQAADDQAAADQQDEKPAEAPEQTAPKRMSWEEIMADPEYNKRMQETVQGRLKSAKSAEETLAKLQPVLEAVCAKYSIDASDASKLDIDGLLSAVDSDNSYYEAKADELGVDPKTARDLTQLERMRAQQQQQEQRSVEEQAMQQHFMNLTRQAEALRATVPDFDLMTEIRSNPRFARMTSPQGGCSVEDAYFACHRQEVMASALKSAVTDTRNKVAASVQSGRARPQENGSASQAPTSTHVDFKSMSPREKSKFMDYLRSETAKGHKVYL